MLNCDSIYLKFIEEYGLQLAQTGEVAEFGRLHWS